jgi:HAD superfamily hydrolase (TIGR01509 family)
MSVTPWPVRSVVFDLDGLLVDTERIFEEAARRLLARRNLTLKRDVLQAMIGIPSRAGIPLFRDGHQLAESVEELTAETTDLFFEVLGAAPAPLLPGALELLDRLEQRGLPRAIATSSSAGYVGKVLGPHGLLSRFAFVLTCDDVRHGKPHPEIYEKAATRFGHTAAEMVVLEDSVNGLRAAKSAGAKCVVVPHELVDVGRLNGADAIVASLAAPEVFSLLGL